MVPSCGATTSFSIFIASRIKTTSPRETLAPGCAFTSRILPGIGALISTDPAAPPAVFAGAAGAGAAGAAGAAFAAGAGAAAPAVCSTVTS